MFQSASFVSVDEQAMSTHHACGIVADGIRRASGNCGVRTRTTLVPVSGVECKHEGSQPKAEMDARRQPIARTRSFGGRSESCADAQRRFCVRWIPANRVKGIACDTPILGYRVNTCNTPRLWKSEAVATFDFQDSNVGDCYGAVQGKVVSETLTKVLYGYAIQPHEVPAEAAWTASSSRRPRSLSPPKAAASHLPHAESGRAPPSRRRTDVHATTLESVVRLVPL